jgi:hypothetical protein
MHAALMHAALMHAALMHAGRADVHTVHSVVTRAPS